MENPSENIFNKEKGLEARVIGGAGEEKKEGIKKIFEARFGEKHLESFSENVREEIKKSEQPKTPEKLELIGLANQKTNLLMERLGIFPRDVPERNIHVVPPELYKKLRAGEEVLNEAFSLPVHGAIILNEGEIRGNDVLFGVFVFHELMHLKSYVSLGAEKMEEKVFIKFYRSGLTVYSALGYKGEEHKHFRGLNEAVVASQEKKYAEEILIQPMFEEERRWMDSEKAKEMKKGIAAEKKISEEEIWWIDKERKVYVMTAYYHQREALKFISEEIQKEFSDKYKTIDEISDEFLKGFFTGRLLPIARLVEKTFGKGSFRILAAMDIDENSAVNTLEAMKSLRRAQTR